MKPPKAPACNYFELTATGGARLHQGSKLGRYKLLSDLTNGRVVYQNQEKGQFLSWIKNKGEYWMVSRITVHLYYKIFLFYISGS